MRSCAGRTIAFLAFVERQPPIQNEYISTNASQAPPDRTQPSAQDRQSNPACDWLSLSSLTSARCFFLTSHRGGQNKYPDVLCATKMVFRTPKCKGHELRKWIFLGDYQQKQPESKHWIPNQPDGSTMNVSMLNCNETTGECKKNNQLLACPG